MTIRLYPFQRRGVNLLHAHGDKGLLADEMGLGKTVQSLWLWKWFIKKTPVVIICPATIKEQWADECLKHLNMRATVLYGRSPPVRLPKHQGIVVVNYDILKLAQEPDDFPKQNTWGNFLVDLQPRLVVLDECKAIKGLGSQRGKAVKQICQSVRKIVALDGTPLTNQIVDLFPIVNLLWPEEFPSLTDFVWKFSNPVLKPWGWVFEGARNTRLLNRKLKRLGMVRRRKEDVLKELPAKTRTIVPMRLPRNAMADYENAVVDFVKWLRGKSKRLSRGARKAKRLVQLGYLRRLAALHKLPLVVEWVRNFLNSGEKLLLFGIHKIILKPLKKEFGVAAVHIDGSVVGQRRKALLTRFNTDPSVRLLLGNIDAAGQGWSCISTSHVAFCELAWTPGQHAQAEDRVHGIGRGKRVLGARRGWRKKRRMAASVYYLLARDTIEERLCGLLQKKAEMINEVLDGKNVQPLNIFDQLEKTLRKEVK